MIVFAPAGVGDAVGPIVGVAVGPGVGVGALRQTKRIWTGLKTMLGDGSYGPKGNMTVSGDLGVTLFTRERSHERRSKWGCKAAEVAALQHEHPDEFNEIYRDRSRGETPHQRIKRHQPYQRLRRRFNETAMPRDADSLDTETLCDLPDDELEDILASARAAVGVAQANEAFAQYVAANVREIVVLEHLHDQRMSLAAGSAFTPITTVNESDLRVS